MGQRLQREREERARQWRIATQNELILEGEAAWEQFKEGSLNQESPSCDWVTWQGCSDTLADEADAMLPVLVLE